MKMIWGKLEDVPGYYGSLKIEESVIQQIWAQQEFFTNELVSCCEKHLSILNVGEWNKSLEGPDFRNAEVIIDGVKTHGDIEIHFEPDDWVKHGHHIDPNFERVILQVSVFANRPSKSVQARTKLGKHVPTLVLLPYLFYSLEEFAETFALHHLNKLDPSKDEIVRKLPASPSFIMRERIKKRWRAKMSYAKARLSVQDFKDACHQWFLEILGYPRNRPAMARIAHLFPWNYWQSGKIDLKKAWETGGNWKMLGTRPANHPKVRLKQYLQLWHSNPSWMDDLLCFTKTKSMVVSSDLRLVRQFVKAWRNDILRGVFAQGKANTLWIDMAWPICCAFHQHNGETLWHNWPAGDCPRLYRHMARKAGWTDGTARHPLINAYVQCIIESLTVFSSQDES